MVSHSGLITVMERAARKAAPRLRRDFNEVQQLQVSRKGPADFVSMADKRAEETLYEELKKARPDWGFLMEEGGIVDGDPTKPRWIIDPLDGTTNFLHGMPHFAISIAVEEPKARHPCPFPPRSFRLSAADRRKLLGGKGQGCLASGSPATGFGAPRSARCARRDGHSLSWSWRFRGMEPDIRRRCPGSGWYPPFWCCRTRSRMGGGRAV